MLVLMQDNKIIQTVKEGGWLDLPNGDRMSPAVAGWSSGPYSLRTAPPDPAPTEDDLVAELCSNLRTQRDICCGSRRSRALQPSSLGGDDDDKESRVDDLPARCSMSRSKPNFPRRSSGRRSRAHDHEPRHHMERALTAALAVAGFILKAFYDEQQRQQILLNKTREELARDYVTRVDMHADINRVITRIDNLDAKIERLLDRLVK